MTRKALGRGLSALIHEPESQSSGPGIQEIAVTAIEPNPFQPRNRFDNTGLEELAESIRNTGLVQPVLVRRLSEDRYQLVAGERRWRAATLSGLEAIPALVRELTDQEALELALTENLLREDLNQMEVARGYEQLQRKFGVTHEEIALRVGSNRVTVTNTLRLLRLPSEVQEMIEDGRLTAGHGRAILGLATAEEQLAAAQNAIKRAQSVRQLEEILAKQQAGPRAGASTPATSLDPNTRAAVLELERTLGTKVKLVGDGNRGRIEISYFSGEDLNRIYELIIRTEPGAS
jgi:ParB family chromosome partitioning protein